MEPIPVQTRAVAMTGQIAIPTINCRTGTPGTPLDRIIIRLNGNDNERHAH